MSEYAIRKIDNQEIHIGSCESMYHCRYDQRKEIIYPHSTDDLYWRIPIPDEDGILPGNYETSLLKRVYDGISIPWKLAIDVDKLNAEDKEGIKKDYGIIQLHERNMGLLVNLRCPHGLPIEQFKKHEDGALISMGYNGHKDTLYLKGLKNTPRELRVLIECSTCRKMWSFSFNDIEPMIKSIWMRLRLLRQISDYHYLHNEGKHEFIVKVDVGNNKNVSICSISKDRYLVKREESVKSDAPWDCALKEFVNLLPRISDFETNDVHGENSKLYNIASQAEEIRSNINNI